MSFLRLVEQSVSPGAPAAGKAIVYAGSDGRLRSLNSDGVETLIANRPMHNLVRNSAFWFAQRQNPASAVTYSSLAGRVFTADGWALTNETASATYQRTDTMQAPEVGMPSRYYGSFVKITNAGKLFVSQVIEATSMSPVRGRCVRVQVWMKQIVASTPMIRLGLVQVASTGTPDTIPATFISAFNGASIDPTLGTNLSYIPPSPGTLPDNATIVGNALSCALSSNWQRFGGVFDVPDNAENLILCVWSNPLLVANTGFAISQAMVVDAAEIQEFCPEDLMREYHRVCRHYFKSFAIETAPAQNVGLNTGEARWTKVVAGPTPTRSPTFRIPTRMFPIAGTTTTFNPAAANAQIRDTTAGADCTATAAVVGDDGLWFTGTGAAGTAAEAHLGVHYTVDREL